MSKTEDKPKAARPALGLLAAAAALLCLGLFAAPAQAGFEGVGCFASNEAGSPPPATPLDACKPVNGGKFGEEVQLGGVAGMAVNYTGAGGVTAGTVYAASKVPATSGTVRIAMFKPKVNGTTSELELKFSLGWEVTVQEEPYERCGPDLLPAPTVCPPLVEGAASKVDVDVDEETGNVYVSNATRTAGRKLLVEYTPKGDAVITRFGEIAPAGKTTAETPAQIHDSFVPGGIAVNDAGEVYVYDANNFGTEYHRLMKFRPITPGVFTEYEYAGTGEDLGAGFSGQGRRPLQPVADAAGNVYVAPDQTHIEVYDPADPGQAPVCDFELAQGGITGITVNPETGHPFFFSYRIPKHLYELGACNPATHKFEGKPGEEIVDEITVAPERDDLWGLAFDPVAKFSPTRQAGVLYGGAPAPLPSQGVGVGEEGQSSLGYIFAPAEENPPVVKSESVSKVSESSARLHAVIDPKSFKTHYAFQYLTEAAYQGASESFAGASEAPLGGAFVSGAAQGVAVTLTGLLSDTAYRYRAVATSSCAPKEPEKVCADDGAAEAFHTYPAQAPGLRDGRAYELVSPAQKNGGQVLPAEPGISSCGSEAACKPGDEFDHFPMQSSPGGDAVVYEGTSFAPGTGVTRGNEYVARRDPQTGWQTVNLSPTLMQKEGRGYKAFDEALSEGLLGQTGPALSVGAPGGFKNLYARQTENPFVTSSLLSAAPEHRPASGSGAFEARYVGAAADLSRIFFEANDTLTGVVPGIAPAPEEGGASKFNLYEWERASGQLRLVNVFPGNATTKAGASIAVASTHAVSADGTRVFWSDEAGQVYLRIGATETRKIEDPGKFLSASTDGSKVLLANGHLYDVASEAVTDLTAAKGGFQGIAGQSDDLSRVYFVDTEVLTAEEVNSLGAKAQAGKFNLYAWVPGTTRYVATLVGTDNTGTNLAHSATWSPLPSKRTAQASPAGRFLAFLSQAALTGYDNTGQCESNHANGFVEAPCPEVFFYDSATEELTCPSCNRSGARPLGLSALRAIKLGEDLPQPRYLTDSGRLYFDSQDSLSQFDTNDGIEDVYEFEPEGVGGCGSEGGCVALISSGQGSFDANLLAVDESGANVFFTTRNRLVLADADDLIDLYDAREGGGFASEAQLPQGPCQGEGCQLPPPAPPLPPPSSQTLEDPGNPPPAKGCKKGQVKKKGKCVKKHKPKKGAKKARKTGAAGGGSK